LHGLCVSFGGSLVQSHIINAMVAVQFYQHASNYVTGKLLPFCLSVRLSVKHVDYDKTKYQYHMIE